MVPVPPACALVPVIESQENFVALKSIPGRPTFVMPAGVVAPPSYFTLVSNCTLPVKLGLVGKAPSGELNQPPPVTKPAPGSKTTSGEKVEEPKALPRDTLTLIEYAPAVL